MNELTSMSRSGWRDGCRGTRLTPPWCTATFGQTLTAPARWRSGRRKSAVGALRRAGTLGAIFAIALVGLVDACVGLWYARA
jgi:hypothetical protein